MYMYKRQSSSNLDENAALGLLQHLNKDELQQLLDDEVKMVEVIQDLAQVRNIVSEKDELIASNKSLAEYNLQREPRLVQARQQLARVYQQGVDIQKHVDTNKQKLDYSSQQLSTDTALAVLQSEAATAEEESEDLAEQFLDGKVKIDDFLEKFLKQRSLAHTRRVKVEKMQEIMSGRTIPRTAPAPINKPLSSYAGGNHSMNSSVPYPMFTSMPNASAYLPPR